MLRGRRTRHACSLVLVLAVAFTGCRRTQGDAVLDFVSEDVPVEMTIKARGAIEVDFEGEVPAKYTMAEGEEQSLLGLRPVDAIRHRGAAVVPGMSVVPYRGDGSYVVAKKDKEGAPGGVGNAVSFVIWANGDMESEPVQFDQPVEACTIKISKDGTRGDVKCPKLSNLAGDKTISFDFEWKAPKVEPKPTTTIPFDSSTSSSTPAP